ncbi:TSUP family transporter [Lysinibacillus sphaericus]|uniref:Probable membrane transporter protein n=1 Tax=Lysinibacillus sphaericus OT4b.31 TaxID=1285586 RepID=R7ZCP8_LYSSH|nr:TSUP family transporter [Lysinibacillus sphaericus]EON71897.1 permease [Lysinibacillus sphaericus OT4b.31]
MQLDLQLLLILILIGFLAAFIDSVVGGGGLIALPALLFLGLNPTTAIATSKLASSIGLVTSTISFYRSGKIDFHSVTKFFPLAFFGSLLGAWTVTLISPDILKPLMLFMLAAIAIYTIFKKDWGSISVIKNLSPIQLAGFIILLFTIGFYDGFLGPGTGSFFIFAFIMIGTDFLKAAGNAKLLNLGSNIAALFLFMYLGHIHYFYGLVMGAAQIFGSIVGSQVAIRKGSGFVRQLFIIVSITLLIKNSYDYFFS